MQVHQVAFGSAGLRYPHSISAAAVGYIADYYALKLASAYQPIFSFAHRHPVGYEALLRGRLPDHAEVFPEQIFSLTRDRAEKVTLDLLARELHLRNFAAQDSANNWLFINVSPDVFINAPRHAELAASLSVRHHLAPYRIVIEVVESAIADEAALAAAVQFYRNLGCLIALDDFGAGHSNFGRIWSIEPDIVKIDRQLTQQAATSKKSRRMLANLVAMLHEGGSLVLMEGVETESEALAAMAADIDLVQGYFFGRPQAYIPDPASYPVIPSDLNKKYRDAFAERERINERQKYTWPLLAFRESARALESDQTLDSACFRLLKHEGVECSYLLSADGVQVGKHLESPSGSNVCDPRYAPLFDTVGANWFRRPFFQNAVNHPGQVHISTPYLSLTGSYMCVTFSEVVRCGGATYVFCCDLNADRLDGMFDSGASALTRV